MTSFCFCDKNLITSLCFMLFNNLKELLLKGNSSKVIEQLFPYTTKLSTPEFEQKITLLSHQLHKNEKDINLGLITREDYKVSENNIVLGLLNLIDSLERFQTGGPSYGKEIIVHSPKVSHICDPRLYLSQVIITNQKAILNLTYQVNTSPPSNGPNINSQTYIFIKRTNEKLVLNEGVNIPFHPVRKSYDMGQIIVFQLIFPPLPPYIQEFDLIESDDDIVGSFNIRRIQLGLSQYLSNEER